ncbi:hypothetical protein C8Q70DRAFT_1048960 [Cubamyces menziesii]|uniref:HSF-type DNA-binding domain-containing protein n=1 Tax=Trametes cubensis TaxID=1111947 RepID=A0AAD7U2J5_9APHY|nr:hypothetical protein C8Q70DRAFT_1048960 [Cubamyces menziesii]KAJ8496797.1 hypothetical protein ONZ51_g894 [Trametes cubensis]
MSQSSQVAIAGPSALAEPPRPVKTGQHNIPRFLLKLYEIINDPANEQLIKWSEAGDSFYIYHQERFAREVLGKWFKHQNFSSFVRQLNLYGFRKISALQQGLLRMDHDTETIQFAHPYFHRGQPDLLALIQRKRHPPTHTQAEEVAAGLLQASQDGKLSGQAVDVRSIVDGITAIRRQQQAIAADLGALKQSNDALWKEAIEARQRHAKHEDTINRILKFLAGLFGRVMQGHSREQLHAQGQSPPRRQMLMIGDGRPGHGEGADTFGGSDYDAHSDTGSRPHSPFSVASERFATIETPDASVTTVGAESATKSPSQRSVQPSSDWPSKDAQAKARPITPSVPISGGAQPIPSVPVVEQGRATPNPDAVWQATFQQMLNSPTQFHRIVQAFANGSQSHPLPTPGPGPRAPGQSYSSELSNALQFPTYGPTPPSASAPQQQQLTYPASYLPNQSSQFSAASPAPTDHALLDNAMRMQKAYHDTAEIDADIDVLQSNIHSLIRDMGLDPNNVSFPTIPAGADQGNAGATGVGVGDENEFPFDSWLNQLSSSTTASGAGAGMDLPDLTYPGGPGRGEAKPGEEFSTYLDLPSFDSGAGSTPTTQSVATPSTVMSSPTGQKRKLEVVEIPEVSPEVEAPSSKKKR